MIKVAHIVSDLSRAGWGVSKVAENLSSAQIKTGILAQVFGVGGKAWKETDADLWNGAPAIPSTVIGPRSLSYVPFLAKNIISWKPDILHLHGIWNYHAYAALKAQIGCNVPILISPHGMLSPISLNYSKLKKKIVSKLYQDKVLSYANAFHATSKTEVEDIASYNLKKPVYVVPNGVEVVNVPHKLMAQERKRVLSLGRIDHKKGLHRLIDAWSLIEDKFDDWSLEIVGTDSKGYRRVLEKQIIDLNLKHAYIKDGIYGVECDKLIASSEIFVLPTLSESWPLSVGQALMLEVPAIVTKGAPFPELIERGCGDWISHGSDAMAKSLMRMMSLTRSKRKKMGKLGRDWVLNDLSWMKIAKRFIDIYKQLIEDKMRV